MRCQSTLLAVMALMSGHADVVNALPHDGAGSSGGIGGDSGATTSITSRRREAIKARGELLESAGGLQSRQVPIDIPPVPTNQENLAAWFLNAATLIGVPATGAWTVYYFGSKLYICVLEAGWFRRQMREAGVSETELDERVQDVHHNVEVVEDIVDHIPGT